MQIQTPLKIGDKVYAVCTRVALPTMYSRLSDKGEPRPGQTVEAPSAPPPEWCLEVRTVRNTTRSRFEIDRALPLDAGRRFNWADLGKHVHASAREALVAWRDKQDRAARQAAAKVETYDRNTAWANAALDDLDREVEANRVTSVGDS